MRIKLLNCLIVLLLSATALPAQWNAVSETNRMMSFGSRPAFRVEFPTTDESLVEQEWKAFVKRSFDAKLKKNKKTAEWMALGVQSSMLGKDPVSIFSTVEEQGDRGSVLTVWFDAGEYFINRAQQPRQADEIVGMLRQFYFDVRRATIGQEIKAEENRMKELENRQKRLVRDNEALRRSIDSYREKLKKAEEDLRENEKAQEAAVVDVEAQRRAMEEVRRRLENVENEKN
jgi:hypothetical protein